ncbi:transglycosylase family protein [Streptomyces sp. NPDC002574]|uniref:LysM peptidoglycan-binding domain-containing protein n=1 Tax=Streptomyces sp. NPDC002574 TaxID=3364652 RepID=UPI0036A107FC
MSPTPSMPPRHRAAAGAGARGLVALLLVLWPALICGRAFADPVAHAPVWQDVAQCESGGRWEANSGNGFYGGLQIYQPTWVSFGGLDFADRADLASADEQITVAEAILRSQGWQAWPTCSRRLGLYGRAHAVQPGDTLQSVAERFSVAGGAAELIRLNEATVAPDPLAPLAPGTLVRLP